MIQLKSLIREITDADLAGVMSRIKSGDFRFIAQGDNGRVYELPGTDKAFKLTRDLQEREVAEKLESNWTTYSTFIPVYYVGDYSGETLIVMNQATPLSADRETELHLFVQEYKKAAYEAGGEVSIFDVLPDVQSNYSVQLVNFLTALKMDIQRMGIPELDLDLDFKTDNVMMWNGKMVLVDW